MLWYTTLWPRVRNFLPCRTILEIAPGHGRFTVYLKDLCQRLVAVDVNEACIQACRARFAAENHMEFHVNDGKSLAAVSDESVDFAFSFDSLVHAEADVIEAYLQELANKLTPGGIAFIHHSNMGACSLACRISTLVPKGGPLGLEPRSSLILRGLLPDSSAWRAQSVTAERVRQMGEARGLRCLIQEKISWKHGKYLIDCLSVLARAKPGVAHGPVRENPGFAKFAAAVKETVELYRNGPEKTE
ncbi:MAG: class I SAM-dependent methyltransferase [Terriglobales bacterium]